MTDFELINQYIQTRSTDAIEQLVRRHVGWVHAVAMRRLRGDAHLAEDVTQAVFLVLSRKPPQLRHQAALSGWLFRVACQICNRVVQAELRRKRREREFAMEHHESQDPAGATGGPPWPEVAPLLDQAVLKLSSADREIVLLRFYQSKSHEELAKVLGISAVAARQRVSRAVAALRRSLAAAGVSVSSTALGASLSTELMLQPSAALVNNVTKVALAHLASSTSTSLGRGVIFMLTIKKSLITLGCSAAALLLAGGAAILIHRPSAPGKPPAAEALPIISWQDQFNAVYRMSSDEAIKNVPLPYIPERLSYYTINQAKLAQANPQEPPIYIFEWQRGQLKRWGTLSGVSSRPVSVIIPLILQINGYEVDAPSEFMNFEIDGDWIRRFESPPAERLAALCDIVRDRSGPVIRFAKRDLPRPALIVTGEVKLLPAPNLLDAQPTVHLYVDDADLAVAGKSDGNETVNELIEELDRVMKMPVMAEITGGGASISDMRHNLDRIANTPTGAERDRILRQLLDHLEQQTNLKLNVEQRMLPTWVGEPIP